MPPGSGRLPTVARNSGPTACHTCRAAPRARRSRCVQIGTSGSWSLPTSTRAGVRHDSPTPATSGVCSVASRPAAAPPGHQEIAFLVPASGGDTWERLVAAVDAMQADWPRGYPRGPQLRVRKDKAFVELTADVAELALWLDSAEGGRLWLRWYKLS